MGTDTCRLRDGVASCPLYLLPVADDREDYFVLLLRQQVGRIVLGGHGVATVRE